MKGIILAGGTGSRLYPLTKVTNKHLLPVGEQPMIYHPIRKLTEVGIREILIVTGTDHMGDVVNLLGSGKDFDCRFTYKVQDEAGGIAQALGLAENFVGDDTMTVILGDNIFQSSLQQAVDHYPGKGAQILLKEVDDPQRFGVARVEGNKIIGIEEKPEHPKSNLAVTGIYMYDARVFDYIRTLEPSDRGELEITDVNNHYIAAGQMHFSVMEGWWTDAGTQKSYKRANELVDRQEA
ncbi:sugar phosphate nucleotidyltransferase [Fodinibius sediminis]|uniref:glucose-1-phosphate thymidylyltransferase n=1 Tax=Fodinibius sediminis TaxID=1214077 RepID=A0A521BVT2_9BACT|nr:sugar phosphate nucleotidyltransferase [Fodinibius sediminis]SMO51302.1 glucose-1-phosphate thymidylyltransferase [Fodinibius sediminis]